MTAAHSRLTFAGEANACAVFNAGRNGDGKSAFLADAPRPQTCAAGVFDDATGALALWTGALNREKALLRANATVAAATRAVDGRGSRRSALPLAFGAGDGACNVDFFL